MNHPYLIGIDEAGRGPWTGSVFAGAVVLNPAAPISGLNDSKKLSHTKRELLFNEIMQSCMVGVGIATVEEIDNLNAQ